VNKTEVIEVAELSSMLRQLHFREVDKDVSVDELLSAVDRDDDGSITWDEFVAMARLLYRRDMERADKKLGFETGSPTSHGAAGGPELSVTSANSAAQEEAEAAAMLKQRADAIEEVSSKRNRRFLTLNIVFLFVTSYLPLGMMPVLAHVFEKDLHLSDTELGLLPLAYTGGFTFFTFLVAILSTKVRWCGRVGGAPPSRVRLRAPRSVQFGNTYMWVMFFLCVNAGGVAFTSVMTNFTGILIMRVVAGAGNCVFGIFFFPMLYALEPYHPLLWSGLCNAMVPVAMGIGYVGTGQLLEAGVSWQAIFGGVGCLIGANTLMLGTAIRGFRAVEVAKQFASTRKVTYKKELRKIYCNPFNLWVAIIANQFYFVLSAIQYWVVIYYVDVVGVSRSTGSFVAGAIMVVSAFVGSLSGALLMTRLNTGVRGSMLCFMTVAFAEGLALIVLSQLKETYYVFPATAVVALASSAQLPLINDIPIKTLSPRYQDFGSSRLSMLQVSAPASAAGGR
jgi:MFS family permease